MALKDQYKTPQERLIAFAAAKGLTKTAFHTRTGLSNGLLSKKGEITSGSLEKIFNEFPDINLSWVLTGIGSMYRSLNADNDSAIDIPITDLQAAAGNGTFNPANVSHQDAITMPERLIKKGTHLCVKVKGDSMAPTLQDGGYVMIRLLEPAEWADMPQERIYVVVDKESKAHIKRLKNRLNEHGLIVLMSDNPAYASYNLEENEIISIWYVEWYFSAKMPNIHDSYYNRLQRLEDRVEELAHKIEGKTDKK